MLRLSLSEIFILTAPPYILAMLYFLVINKKKTHYFLFRFTLIYGFIAYMITLLSLTILPDDYYPIDHDMIDPLLTLQLIPFKTMLQTFHNNTWFIQFLGNIIVFMPFTLFVGLLQQKNFPFFKGLFVGFLFSLFIELSQLALNLIANAPLRSPDVDDLILNTLGGVLGWMIYRLSIHLQLIPMRQKN